MALAETEDRSARVEKLLRVLVVAVSVLVMLLFVVTALERLRYPYELEELEGYVFLNALRVFHGQSAYPHPTLAFVPYMYPPGYYYACAAVGRVMGMTIQTLRTVSILSTLGCFAAIYALVWSEVRKHLPAVAAAGLYAGCYAECRGWFDLGRLDSFFVLLVLLAMLATRRAHPVVAAVVWTLAFQTKQSILPAAIIMLCFDFGRSHEQLRRTLSGLLALGVGVGCSVLWLNHATQGWYSYYVFTIPRANADLQLRTAVLFWPADMLQPLALALIVIVAGVVFTHPQWTSRATRFYLASCSLVPLFWWIRTHSGSTVNALMPVYALVAVLFGIALARLVRVLPAMPLPLAMAGVPLLLLAALAQEAAGIYNPGAFRPNQAMTTSMAAVVAQVRAVPGDVYVTQHPYYAYLAGKPFEADIVSLHDAMRPDGATREDLRAQVQAAFATHRYVALIFDHPEAEPAMDAIDGGTGWRSGFPVQHAIPGVASGERPGWIMLPSSEF